MSDSATLSAPTQHVSLTTPTNFGSCCEFAENPYDYLPTAPIRHRESSTADVHSFDFRISREEKPISERLFLDLDASSSINIIINNKENTNSKSNKNNRFISLSPKHKRRNVLSSSSSVSNIKHLVVSSSSESLHLGVKWIEMRPNRLFSGTAMHGNKHRISELME